MDLALRRRNRCRGVIGVSSICPETCERHTGAIVSIQKALSEDAIRTPSKMDGSPLPGAQKGGSTSLKWCQGVGCSGDRGARLTMTARGLAQE